MEFSVGYFGASTVAAAALMAAAELAGVMGASSLGLDGQI
jgi:hypothetical protein